MSWTTLGVTVAVVGVLLQVLWYLKKVRKEGWLRVVNVSFRKVV